MGTVAGWKRRFFAFGSLTAWFNCCSKPTIGGENGVAANPPKFPRGTSLHTHQPPSRDAHQMQASPRRGKPTRPHSWKNVLYISIES